MSAEQGTPKVTSPQVTVPLVTLTIDGKQLSVPKGTNLIEAAKSIGVEIPHYCYHPHLSVPGNCRMCQVEVTGQAKLQIGCNTPVAEGMEVKTQSTSEKTRDAQAATLEFILINHPLDCTVCDQAGHCKLQDYHYEYNARPSRFLEKKEHKIKAQPLGPTVILDGERCIMCTRCIRFCDEVTGTSELGMLNRGDRSVIAVHPGKELNNPLSGTVVDLCPVGALTHRNWRFNSRIWFTKETESICPGCSTGCNVKVAVRDSQVVQVKARFNSEVNKEWLCDEGRYGFEHYLPKARVQAARVGVSNSNANSPESFAKALDYAKGLASAKTAVFLAGDLLFEEFWLVKLFIDRYLNGAEVAVGYRERQLTPVEAVLISPDRATKQFGSPNFRAAQLVGLAQSEIADQYQTLIKRLESGAFENVLLIGDTAICEQDQTPAVLDAIRRAKCSVALLCDSGSKLNGAAHTVFPTRSILEKSGCMVNRLGRLQYSSRVVEFPAATEPHWRIINQLAAKMGAAIVNAVADRELTLNFLAQDSRFQNISIAKIKAGGIDLTLQNGASRELNQRQNQESTGA